jgi:hypothetical protein
MRKKLFAGQVLLLQLSILAIVGQAGHIALAQTAPTQQEINAKLNAEIKKLAASMNATAPTMINDQIRLDKVTPGPGTVITLHSSFVNYSSSNFDSGRIHGEARPQMKQKLCASEELKVPLQLGAKLQYTFQGNDGVAVGNFRFDRTDCGYPAIRP